MSEMGSDSYDGFDETDAQDTAQTNEVTTTETSNEDEENINYLAMSSETGNHALETHGAVREASGKESETVTTTTELGKAQETVENMHTQSKAYILENNGKYMTEEGRERVMGGVDSIKVSEHNPNSNKTGGYMFHGGKATISISAKNETQLERSTNHETFHFTSFNKEIIVPDPERKGYTVYNTVGTRRSSWFHSNETGNNTDYTEHGRGMNEGLTTMYTNSRLSEMSKEKGEAAEREQIYSHATELCKQIEDLVGEDVLKDAYYGGNTAGLESKVNELAGDKEYGHLRDCLDRAISDDYAERVEATKEAQEILARMSERSQKE